MSVSNVDQSLFGGLGHKCIGRLGVSIYSFMRLIALARYRCLGTAYGGSKLKKNIVAEADQAELPHQDSRRIPPSSKHHSQLFPTRQIVLPP
jgi:hypothetical protein